MIQHRIYLFAAGFEYNAAAGMSLADSREALLRYQSRSHPLRPVEERTVDDIQLQHAKSAHSAGGVFALLEDASIRLFTLGSTLRGIRHNEWKIPLPVDNPDGYCFDPSTDVIAFVEQQQVAYVHWSRGFKLRPQSNTTVICRLESI